MKNLVIFFTLALLGCKSVRNYNNVNVFNDKLEHMVIVGFKTRPPAYLRYTPGNIGFYLLERQKFMPTYKPGEEIDFWCYAVYYDDYYKPVDQLRLKFEIIKSGGESYSPASYTETSVTDSTGYNKSRIRFVINDQFTYRLKVTYKDKNTTTVSYSPNFLVSVINSNQHQ